MLTRVHLHVQAETKEFIDAPFKQSVFQNNLVGRIHVLLYSGGNEKLRYQLSYMSAHTKEETFGTISTCYMCR